MVSKVNCAMVMGTVAKMATVEADVSTGLPTMEMTGNLSTSVKDSKERIRVAIKKSGFSFPQGRITVNISPADFRKEGTGFDLAIACAILSEIGAINQEISDTVFVGELGLDGSVLKIRGILSITLEAVKKGFKRIVVPMDNALEASMITGIEVIPARALYELVGVLNGQKEKEPFEAGNVREKASETLDFADVLGQKMAKRAMLVAVCGMHNLMLMGPPGAGKTMLASRIPSIMPNLEYEESIDITSIYSLAGLLEEERIIEKRPFRAPHHSITFAALMGGGAYPIPGECSLASKGVLFLDELTKYSPPILEMLREPLEEKKILINRMSGTYEFPADFMLVTAMNPCRCGYYPDRNKCHCSENDIRRHFGRISKPLMDRIDICVSVGKTEFEDISIKRERDMTDENPYTSEKMREIVIKTWDIQRKRYNANRFNSSLSAKEIEKYCVLNEEARGVLKVAYEKFDLSARAYHKILKVARTLADMEDCENISTENVLEAIGLRTKTGE